MQVRRSFVIALSIAACSLTALMPAHALNTVPTGGKVEDTQVGWMWSGMVESNDDSFSGGTAHAGGPGSSGTYTFSGTGVEVYGYSGPDLIVDGRHHKLGKMRITIDGHEKAELSAGSETAQYGSSFGRFQGLSNGVHVLTIEPEGGWAAVDYIEVTNGDTGEETANDRQGGALSGRGAINDPLDSFDYIFGKSDGWKFDTVNAQYLANDRSRLIRTTDTKQYIAYRCKRMAAFSFQIFTKLPYTTLIRYVHIYTSRDSGTTCDLVDYTSMATVDGGNGGGWTGYDLVPKTALPEGTDSVFLVVDAGTGIDYDPEISQVQITQTP